MERTTKIIIQNLTDDQVYQIIADFELFEKDGYIDACLLRTLAQDMSKELQVHFQSLFMNLIAFEAYRYFADKWLFETDAGMSLSGYYTEKN